MDLSGLWQERKKKMNGKKWPMAKLYQYDRFQQPRKT